MTEYMPSLSKRDRARLGAMIALFLSGTLLIALVTAYFLTTGARQGDASLFLEYERSIYGGRQASSLFSRPMGVAVGRDGRVYVTDTDNRRILAFDPDGALVALFPRERQDVRLYLPMYVAVNSKGEVFVSDRGPGTIQVFDRFGRYLREFRPKAKASRSLAWAPMGIAFDEKDNLYVTDVAGHRVIVLSPGGEVKRSLGQPGADPGEFSFANGIAATRGRIYVADSNNGRVQVFDDSGKLILRFSSGSLPRGIAVDALRRIYVADALEHVIRIYRGQDGKQLATIGSQGQREGEFSYPNGLALDGSRLYVADRENHRVQVWSRP